MWAGGGEKKRERVFAQPGTDPSPLSLRVRPLPNQTNSLLDTAALCGAACSCIWMTRGWFFIQTWQYSQKWSAAGRPPCRTPVGTPVNLLIWCACVCFGAVSGEICVKAAVELDPGRWGEARALDGGGRGGKGGRTVSPSAAWVARDATASVRGQLDAAFTPRHGVDATSRHARVTPTPIHANRHGGRRMDRRACGSSVVIERTHLSWFLLPRRKTKKRPASAPGSWSQC